MITTKKAQISKLTAIILSLIVVALVIAFILRQYGLLGKSGQEYTAYTDDLDKDGAINGPKCSYTKAPGIDACPCVAGDLKNDGCPLNHKIIGDSNGVEHRSCLCKST